MAKKETAKKAKTTAKKEKKTQPVAGSHEATAASAFEGKDEIQKTWEIHLKGKSPLKMAPMPDETIINGLIRGDRTKPDKTKPLKDMAAEKLYRDKESGVIGIPKKMLLACLREAGTMVKWGSTKANVTRGSDGKTQLYSFLEIHEEHIPLIVPKNKGENGEGWEVDIDHGKIKDIAVGIITPRFDEWELKFTATITYVSPEVTNAMVGELIRKAGRTFGLGAHRPGRGGPFGSFEVIDIKEVENPSVKAA